MLPPYFLFLQMLFLAIAAAVAAVQEGAGAEVDVVAGSIAIVISAGLIYVALCYALEHIAVVTEEAVTEKATTICVLCFLLIQFLRFHGRSFLSLVRCLLFSLQVFSYS